MVFTLLQWLTLWRYAVLFCFCHLKKRVHLLIYLLIYFIYLKSDPHLPKKFFKIFFNDSPSKMMKNSFYFILKALFVLKIFKGATKSHFAHYSFVVFILFNTGLRKSAFSTSSFRKLVSVLSFCAFCLFCLLCVEFDVIFINFTTFAKSLFIMVSRNLCFCSHLWETVC